MKNSKNSDNTREPSNSKNSKNPNNKKIYISLALALVIIFAVLLFFKRTSVFGSKVVARVGQFEITEEMVKDRDTLIRQRAANETRSLGLQQLKNAYTQAQILINNGHAIDDSVLQKEEERIDKSTLMPEKLQAIKNIFRERKDAYRKVFILPVYAERVIYYEFFLNDERVQAEPYAKAQNILMQVKQNPKAWSELAKDPEITFVKAKVTLMGGFEFIREEKMPGAPRPDGRPGEPGADGRPGGEGGGGGIIDQSPQSATAAEMKAKFKNEQEREAAEVGRKWIDELIKSTMPGNVIDKIINQGEAGYQIVRYIGKTKNVVGSYDLEVAIIRKRDYEKWRSEEAAKIVAEDF